MHDLEARSPDGRPVRAGDAGMTRRGFLAGAGLAAAALAVGGIASRVAPWRHWLDAGGDTGGDAQGAGHSITRRDFTLDSRYVEGPVPYSIAWPPGSKPGDPLPACFALPGRGGAAPMWFANVVARAVGKRQAPPFAVIGVDGGVS